MKRYRQIPKKWLPLDIWEATKKTDFNITQQEFNSNLVMIPTVQDHMRTGIFNQSLNVGDLLSQGLPRAALWVLRPRPARP